MPTFNGTIEAETAKAILFQDHYWDCPTWLPKSQCTITNHGNGEVTVVASDWICQQKGLRENEYRECDDEEQQ